jgi:threonine dehydrogenase-like Zn-dependent dehydrogenase
VVAVDAVAYRLEFARQYNQVEVLNFKEEEDLVARLKEMTAGRGPDVCIDAVGMEAKGSWLHSALGVKLKLEAGAPTALNQALYSVRKGGTVSVVGVYGPPWNLVPIGVAVNKGLTLRMAQCHVKRYMPHLLEHIRAGRIDPRRIITHRFPLGEVARAYELFSEKRDGCIKCVLLPHGHA